MDICVAPSCTDKVKNGDETGVDCGGSCMLKCAAGQGCKADVDCKRTLREIGAAA
jgi:hypothetical protein